MRNASSSANQITPLIDVILILRWKCVCPAPPSIARGGFLVLRCFVDHLIIIPSTLLEDPFVLERYCFILHGVFLFVPVRSNSRTRIQTARIVEHQALAWVWSLTWLIDANFGYNNVSKVVRE